jgi:hypothetical protein
MPCCVWQGRHGLARRDVAGQCPVESCTARQGRQGLSRLGVFRRGVVGSGTARQGRLVPAWQDRVLSGQALPVKAWQGEAGAVERGMLWHSVVRSGCVWQGRHGSAVTGLVGQGLAAHGKAGKVRLGQARQGMTRSGWASLVSAGSACRSAALPVKSRLRSVWRAGRRLARQAGAAWHARPGVARRGPVRHGRLGE